MRTPGRLTFFGRMALMLSLLLVFLGAISVWQTRQTIAGLFFEQQGQRGQSLAGLAAARAASLILVNNQYDLYELLRDMRQTNEDVRYLFVISQEGAILAHTFSGGFPVDLLNDNMPTDLRKGQSVLLDTEEGRVLDVAVPIMEGRLGRVHVGLSDRSLQSVLTDTTRQLWLDTLLVLGIGGIAAFLWARRLTRPIRELAEAAGAMMQGDMSRRAQVSSGDELGQLAVTFNDMSDHVAELVQELRRKEEIRTLLLQKVIGAQEEERKRISRELHDQTGQTLTSLMMGLKCLEENCPSGNRCHLDELRNNVRQTLDNLHRLSLELRPTLLDDMGLAAAIGRYVQQWRELHRMDVEMHLRWDCPDRLAHEVEVAVYRIVQEALTNVAKHANAAHVSVVLSCEGNRLSVVVEDDGIGFEMNGTTKDAGDRLGLFGMEERAQLVGGSLTVEASPGQGTTVYLRVPVHCREGELA
ncbi:MAG: ATP-binding protein [Negativicutes bacterium]